MIVVAVVYEILFVLVVVKLTLPFSTPISDLTTTDSSVELVGIASGERLSFIENELVMVVVELGVEITFFARDCINTTPCFCVE
jgi:hypothetical protein